MLFAISSFLLADTRAEIPSNLKTGNLAVWCVAHQWDSKDRSPAEGRKLLSELGIGRLVYNWRADDNPDFEEEILQCKKQRIESFVLFEKYGMRPQIWKICPFPERIPKMKKWLLPPSVWCRLQNGLKRLAVGLASIIIATGVGIPRSWWRCANPS